MVSIRKALGAQNHVGRGKTRTVSGLLPALVLFGLISAGTAAADDYHYTNNIIGERAAGMAGAFVAVADDTSGLYYNPAGTTLATGNSVSASGNTWRQESKTYNGALGNANYQRNSTTIQPNFFGIVQHTPIGTLGFSYVVPDSTIQQQDQTYNNPNANDLQFTLNYNNQIDYYNIGPSYATDVSKNLKVGLTLYYHYKKRKTINYETTTLSSAGHPVAYGNSLLKDEENGTRPILGIMYAPDEGKYSVGLTVSKTFIFYASQYLQFVQPTTTTQPPQFFTGGVLPDYPTEVRLGAAYFPSNALLVSADLDWFSQANADSFGVYGWTRQQVLNFALGAEYYLSPAFAIRGGAYSDYTNVDSTALAGGFPDDKVDLYGVSLSTAWFSKYSSISLGVNYAWGSGNSNITSTGKIGSMSENILTVFLGTSYNY